MIVLIKLLFTNLASLCIFQVASNIIEYLKLNIITFMNKKDQSVNWKYFLNVILFSIFALLFIAIIDLYMS